jgi:hypothetical protein
LAATIVVGTNSWLTLAEAETYFESRINSDSWNALSEGDKNIYLITAYNWIFYDPGFFAPASATNSAVKNGQCEGALFLINYGEEYEKREALLASGVTEFKFSKWSEKLGEAKKPDSVTNYFISAGYYAGANVLIQTPDLDVSEY